MRRRTARRSACPEASSARRRRDGRTRRWARGAERWPGRPWTCRSRSHRRVRASRRARALRSMPSTARTTSRPDAEVLLQPPDLEQRRRGLASRRRSPVEPPEPAATLDVLCAPARRDVVATARPGEPPARGGVRSAQTGRRCGQRGSKAQPGRSSGGRGGEPRDRRETRRGPLVDARDRAEQPPRVRHPRAGEELARRRLLDDAPCVHHVHPLGAARHDAEVVGDEERRRSRGLRDGRSAA